MAPCTRKTFGFLLLWALPAIVSWSAEIIISLNRTTLSVDEWTRITGNYEEYESLLKTYTQMAYTKEVVGDRIEFRFAYADGWDNTDYRLWKYEYIPVMNLAIGGRADPGIRWQGRAVGEIESSSNPWNRVSWLPEVTVVDGEYLLAPSLGWLWAGDWNHEGGFWAYALSSEINWIYVFGGGYYYNPDGRQWFWNWPGSGWFIDLPESGPGGWQLLFGGGLPTIEALDAVLKDEMILQNLPGLAVGVFENGKFVHLNGYGFRNIETGDPVTTSTIFRWASISKPLTAVATLQLDEAPNSFSVTDRADEHATYWAQNANQPEFDITIEHLLSNRSGIHHYGSGRDEDNDGAPDATYSWNENNYGGPDPSGYDGQAAASVFSGTGLDFTPGDKYLYTTFGFNLLGSAVDEASPNGYVDWVMDNIADPLNMSSLQVATTSRRGYNRDCDGRLEAEILDSQEWKLPGGGWESNIVDLTRFARGIVDGTLLDDTTRLWTPVPENAAENVSYRWGISSAGSGNSHRVWHSGAHSNLRTYMFLRPPLDRGFVIMAFAEWASVSRIAARIEEELYGTTWTAFSEEPMVRCGSTMDSCSGQFAGVWRATGNDVIVRTGYSHDAFLLMWEQMRDCGYYCDDFEPNVKDGQLQWDGIFRKGSGANGIWRNFTFDGFREKWEEMGEAGMRLVDLETYVVNGQRRWAGLFRPGTDDYAMWRNFTTDDFADKRAEMDALGLKLIDIEVWTVDGELRWAGVWREGNDGLLNRNYTRDDFGELVQTRAANGWKLIDIEAYRVNGTQLWAGIWEQSNQGYALWRNWDYCGFMDNHADAQEIGFEMLDIEHYDY
jgi:CubicO group peptidase (beta-lactamase class C family)